MHVDPMILETLPEERRAHLSLPGQAAAPPSPSVTVEQLAEGAAAQGRGLNVLLHGAGASGKSTVVRKLVLAWCAGACLTRLSLAAPFSCEVLSPLRRLRSRIGLVARQ